MIKHIKCNMFDSGADIFCHQVNCQGEMNTGVAAEVRKRYPWVYAVYKKHCNYFSLNPYGILGTYQEVYIDENRVILNIFGQLNFGYDGNCYTDYKKLKQAIKNIADDKDYKGRTIAFPYKMGCHRGGGDWDIVYKLICDAFENSKCDVLICEYDGERKNENV